MFITILCPHCNNGLMLNVVLAGRATACPHCQGLIQVPGASAGAPPGLPPSLPPPAALPPPPPPALTPPPPSAHEYEPEYEQQGSDWTFTLLLVPITAVALALVGVVGWMAWTNMKPVPEVEVIKAVRPAPSRPRPKPVATDAPQPTPSATYLPILSNETPGIFAPLTNTAR